MQDYRVQQAQIYTDFSGLNALKSEARTDKKAALEVVARQFESLFLAEMLKSMRKAGEVFSEGNFLHSSRSDFYQELFDSQLSLTMANTQGTGLARGPGAPAQPSGAGAGQRGQPTGRAPEHPG